MLWSFVGLIAIAVCFLAVAVPDASAQSAQSALPNEDDGRRYSQLLQNIYQFILQNYVDEVDPALLYEGAMKGMFGVLGDPHSLFLDEPMLSDLMRETDGTYAGVGLYISKPVQEQEADGAEPVYVEVVSPIEDTPAWQAGVLPGDLIIKIDGVNTTELSVDEASARIRGPEGSTVVLSFRRGRSYEFDLEFVRATIEIPAVKTGIIDRNGKRVAYLRIIEWMPQTVDRVKEALDEIKKQKAEYLIVDVRSNPGGLLSSVVDVSDLFMDSGIIVSTKGRNPQENFEYTADKDLILPTDFPMVVLVNQGSASASEIFAGAMKDIRRALLLGEKTYGKGSVQQVFPLSTTGFKLTMARYYTPSGVNIDKAGIEPDILVPDLSFTDVQLESLEKLYESDLVRKFADENPEATVQERKARAGEILGMGFDVPLEFVDRLLRDELERTKTAPVFDLEFDIQLNKAIETILSDEFDELLRSSMTLSQALAAN
jgi:carboxyl-terminal processing protease